jgi:hypothetical protein
MVDFSGEDLSGSNFEQVNLSNSRFRNIEMAQAKITGMLIDVEIGAMIQNLRVNGVDVVPLVQAELNRKYPDRAIVMGPQTVDDVSKAWDIVEGLWAGTIDRARKLPPDLLHEQVDQEWSFIETLRHLIFIVDAWLVRTVLGESDPWHRLGLPHDEARDLPELRHEAGLRPSLDEVLEVHADRTDTVGRVIAELTEDQLNSMTTPVPTPGYPQSGSYLVRDCFVAVLSEEWEHRLYAERDLDVLTSRS